MVNFTRRCPKCGQFASNTVKGWHMHYSNTGAKYLVFPVRAFYKP